ncbi:DMT family transporter [Desulfobacula toluolica]|uniref:Prediced tranporter protein n=1 Tax=Desulfobacula toluolica (strain DSM 7467 / Tol2) TaxID=651182 RepID=K0NHN9_DESTT|nr:DMT family transporter [Desulfobacula toluolica]CCK80826.1 prediced tranporter protein [Desulfobacula toluolica Tol2]
MISWYFFALLALLLMGIQRFFYKVAAEKKYPTEWVTFSFMATVTLLSTGVYFFQQHHELNIIWLMTMSLINSASFLVATVSHIEALKYIPANIAYSIIRLNVVVVAGFSIFYFKEQISLFQGIGLLVAVAAMIVLTIQMRENTKKTKQGRRGAVFILLALLCGATASISSKFAAMHVDKLAFIALSYLMGMIGSLGITRALSYDKAKKKRSAAMGLGVVMGGFNFAGFYAFLYALECGPLSLVAAIVGMHFVIAIVLSAIIYRENIKPAGLVGIFLTVISIILIRI